MNNSSGNTLQGAAGPNPPFRRVTIVSMLNPSTEASGNSTSGNAFAEATETGAGAAPALVLTPAPTYPPSAHQRAAAALIDPALILTPAPTYPPKRTRLHAMLPPTHIPTYPPSFHGILPPHPTLPPTPIPVLFLLTHAHRHQGSSNSMIHLATERIPIGIDAARPPPAGDIHRQLLVDIRDRCLAEGFVAREAMEGNYALLGVGVRWEGEGTAEWLGSRGEGLIEGKSELERVVRLMMERVGEGREGDRLLAWFVRA